MKLPTAVYRRASVQIGVDNIASWIPHLQIGRGLPPSGVEFQMFYGMAEPIKDALVSLGQRVRVSTPHAQLLLSIPNLVWRLLENLRSWGTARIIARKRWPGCIVSGSG